MVPIHVAEISTGLNHVAHAALELFGLGEAAVRLAVPEHAGLERGRLGRGRGGGHRVVLDGYYKGSARRRLECHLAQRRGEG